MKGLTNDMWVYDLANYMAFGVPLYVIMLCGVLGISIDIDHPIARYWLKRLDDRFLHTPALIVGSIIFCIAIAYITRLLFEVVLI